MTARDRPTGRAGRPDGGGQDDGRPAAGRALGRRRSATPTTTSRRPRAARSPTSSWTPARQHFRALEREAVARGARRARRACWPLGGGAVHRRRDPRAARRPPRRLPAGRARPTPPPGSGSARRGRCCWATCAARMKAAARRAHAGLRGRRRAAWSTPTAARPDEVADAASRRRSVSDPRPVIRRRHGVAVRRGGGRRRCSAGCPALVGDGVRRVALVFPDDLPGPAAAVRDVLAAALRRAATSPLPAGEEAKTAEVAARLLGGARAPPASPAATPSSRSAGERPPTWAASSRRPGCAACASCTCRPPCWAWSTRRWAARPASTPAPARTSSAPSTSRPACSATSTLLATLPAAELRRGLGEVVKCGFIADPEILRLVEADRAGRRSTPASPLLRELVERAVRVKADVVAGDLRETRRRRRAPGPRGAQLRPHHGPRGRAGERATACGTARPSRIGMVYVAELARARRPPRRRRRRPPPTRRSRGWGCRPAGPARRTTTCGRAMAVDKKSRGLVAALRGARRPGPAADPGRPERGAPASGVRRDGGRRAMKVLVLNGPNLGRLGRRQPEIYGATTYAELVDAVRGVGPRARARGRGAADQPRGRAARLAQPRRRRRARRSCSTPAPGRTTPGPLDACAQLSAPLVEVHLSDPAPAPRGVPPPLRGHAPRRRRDRRQGRRRLPPGTGAAASRVVRLRPGSRTRSGGRPGSPGTQGPSRTSEPHGHRDPLHRQERPPSLPSRRRADPGRRGPDRLRLAERRRGHVRGGSAASDSFVAGDTGNAQSPAKAAPRR